MALDFNTQPAASAQQPEPASQSDMAYVTIRVDADAFMLCDGEYMEDIQLKAGIIKKMQLPIGQHLLEFINSDNPDIKVEKQVDFPLPNRNYLVLVNELKALVDKRVAQLEQQRMEEEAERKRKAEEAARKKAEEVAERKRKAEEAERKRKAEEAERKRKAEEAARKKAEEEAKRKRLEEEAARKKAEEEAEKKRKAEEAARKKAEEERVKKMTPSQKFKEGKKILEDDYDWGLEVIKIASNEGLAEASKFLAFGFAGGENGIKKQESLAYDYFLAFLKQADNNDKDLGKVYFKLGYGYQYGEFGASKNFEKSVKYYEQAAKLGYVEALAELAFGYDDGDGCFPKDEEKALKYYLEFAAKGNETYASYKVVLFILGTIYFFELNGVERDKQKAFSYYKKSAELGYQRAKYCLIAMGSE